jgi:hypothetical protein
MSWNYVRDRYPVFQLVLLVIILFPSSSVLGQLSKGVVSDDDVDTKSNKFLNREEENGSSQKKGRYGDNACCKELIV